MIAPVKADDQLLTIISGDQRNSFTVEIADTPGKKMSGLMYRKEMADDAGMLFVFDELQEIIMWMKNTYIPLDIIFIDETAHINYIAENTTPLSTKIIQSKNLAIAALEVNAGTAKRLSIRIGDKVEHPMLLFEEKNSSQ